MKLAILSRSPGCYSTRRIVEAAQAAGHRVKVMDTLRCSIYVEEERPSIRYMNEPLPRIDAVIPRIGSSITHYGTAVVRQFEQMGIFTLNTSASITVSRDKLRSLQILSRHKIGIPASAFVRSKADVWPAIERVGGAPVIVKLLEGTQGVGVILAESQATAAAIIEMLQSQRQNVLIQKFVAESKGRDVRAFVVGDQVVGAMRRRAQGSEFRSNVHRGGTTETVELSPEYEQTAVRAAQIMGLQVAGVDMLESADGPKIMEVNSSPGLEGIEGATGLDIAGRMIEHVEQRKLFPEIDIRQRLTLKAGYGVADIFISDQSDLAHRTLAEAGLRERDILVLSIYRQGVTFPNPHGENDIKPGDTLLCFGKLVALRALAPATETDDEADPADA